MITKEQFEAYLAVRDSGVTNMFDRNRVQDLTGLSRPEVMEIMERFGELLDEYPQP